MERLGALYMQVDLGSSESRRLLERYIAGEGVICGWGLCREGELGTGARYNLITPFMIGGLDKPVRMACCGLSSVWLGMRNVIMTMGSGMWGELAVGNPRFCPRVIANEMNMPICTGQIEVQPLSPDDLMVDVSAGFAYFACVSLKGAVFAWGANNYGQCHHDMRNACCGYAQPRVVPNEIVVQVACANFAVIARTMTGSVYGWGLSFMLGDEGQLKEQLRITNSALVPVANTPDRQVAPDPVKLSVFEGKDITLIRAGPWHFAAVTSHGEVYTWGLGNNGRLGHGSEDDQLLPTVVSALKNKHVIEAACGSYHTVFVTSAGEAYACGDNQGGQCGKAGVMSITTPELMYVAGHRRVTHASCGRHHTILLLETGEMVAYGTGMALGVGCGYGMRQVRCQPVMDNYVTLWLSSGATHNFALTIPKTTSMLVLGVPHRGVPAALASIGLKEGILSCGVGAGFTIMISRRGSCYAFGVGGWGQLGIDTTPARDFTPERVPVMPHATRITYFARTVVTYVAAGFSFSMCITEGERVYAWGNNSYGQCGLGADPKKYQRIPQPREITWLADKQIMQVACGSYFALALSDNGDVYSWGIIECCGHGLEPSPEDVPPNMFMRDVGSESRGVVLSPAKIVGLSNIIQVAAGGWHALALNSIGEIFAWGVGTGGRLGLGHCDHVYVPTRIAFPAFFTRIGCGCYTSFGVADEAKLYLWGVNDRCQLGRSGKVTTPQLAYENVRDVCLGKYFTLLLTYNNTFHMSGEFQHDHGTYTSKSFDDTDRLPERLRPDKLAEEHYKGVRVFGGLEHAIVLVEKDTPPPAVVQETTSNMRRLPEYVIRKANRGLRT